MARPQSAHGLRQFLTILCAFTPPGATPQHFFYADQARKNVADTNRLG